MFFSGAHMTYFVHAQGAVKAEMWTRFQILPQLQEFLKLPHDGLLLDECNITCLSGTAPNSVTESGLTELRLTGG